jgi:NDP-sugar pyrophosphorylase family protein
MRASPRWPALVLTAGLGTRLRPLTYHRAKAAIPVAGESLVRRILKWLAVHGITDVVLNLHHQAHTITAIVGDGSDLGLRVRYSWEDPVLGSAGGPRRALPLVGSESFVVKNGDTLTDLDPGRIAREHERSGALVTLAVAPNREPERYGGVLVDDDGRVAGFSRAGDPQPSFHFIGVQAAAADAFADLSPDRRTESVTELYPRLLRDRPGSVRAVVVDATFHDVGTAADYLETSLALARLEGLASLPWGRGCSIDPSSRVERSILWEDVTVEASCEIVDCVVADGVRIPAGSRFERRTIASAARAVASDGDEVVGDLLVAPLEGRRRRSREARRA